MSEQEAKASSPAQPADRLRKLVPLLDSWDQVDDATLPTLRVCDLPVRIEGSVLEARIRGPN